jgi:hypothetical protein
VTTNDAGDARMTRTPLDTALADLLAFQPRAELLAGLDERVNLAAALGSAAPAARRRPARPRRRTVIGLLAAAVIVAGAGGALGIYENLGASFEEGFGLQLDHSVAVGATEVHDGYRVTIDRGYLDGERLMLTIVATDELQRPDIGQLMAMYAVVSDGDGQWQGAGTATARPIGQWSAANVIWRLAPAAPLPAGSHRFHVEVPHIFVRDMTATPPADETVDWNPFRKVFGPWTFDIELPVDGGAAVATPGTIHTIAGVPVVLRQVFIGPSAIRIEIEVDDPDRATWTFLGHVRRGDRVFPIVTGRVPIDGIVRMQADGGTNDASGDWSVVITEARRQGSDDVEERIPGPWTYEFQVP